MGDYLTSNGIRINVSSLKEFLTSGKLTKSARLVAVPCQRYNIETGWQYPFNVKVVGMGADFILSDGQDHLVRLVAEKLEKDYAVIVKGDKLSDANVFIQTDGEPKAYYEYDLLFGYDSDTVNETTAEGRSSDSIPDLKTILVTPAVVNGCKKVVCEYVDEIARKDLGL